MLTPGTTLGPYKILAPLGAGGMGEVYRARDTRLARDVALKVVRGDLARDPDRHRRFEQEARAAGALNHPNVCTIFDVGSHENAPFVVMELLEGESVRARLHAGAIPLRKALDYAAQVARGLAAAHEKGIVHRDLKPENLFVTRDGRVKVLDFGLAKLTRPEALTDAGDPTISLAATESGAILGTAGYMSPEQVRGQAVDARTDIFALGAIVYEMVSGRRAFTGASFVETAHAILKDEPPVLSSGSREIVPVELELIVRRCLEKGPAQRFQSASDLAFGLEALASGQGRAVVTPVSRTQRRFGRAWVTALVVMVVVALGAASAWQGWWPLRTPEPARPAKKDWILVAEFQGPPGDSTVAQASRSLLSAALDQSHMVATVPQDAINRALKSAGKPEGSPPSPELARELAYRAGVRAVLECEIGRIGSGYSIVARIVAADTSRALAVERETAKNEDGLIDALGKVARNLRRDLGENREALRATRPMMLAATPSFEAYKLYRQAWEIYFRQSNNRGAIARFRAALAIDPDFASAWSAMALMYTNLGYPDSQRVCIDEALRHPDRLSGGQQVDLAKRLAILDGDFAGAAAEIDRVLADDPANLGALSAADDLWAVGRFEDALEHNRRAAELRPFGPRDADWINIAADLYWLGRFDEAREAVNHETGIWREPDRVNIEWLSGNMALAESLATRLRDNVRLRADVPDGFSGYVGLIQFSRGALKSAAVSLDRSDELSRAGADSAQVQGSSRLRVIYASVSGGAFPMPSDVWTRDTSTTGLVSRGLRATFAGDVPVARRCLASVRARPARSLVRQGAGPALLEARIALSQGDAEQAVRILQPLSLQRVERGDGYATNGVGLGWVRWTLADAFESLGQPDSAASHLERTLGIPLREADLWPSFHRRLALIYARTGRAPEAIRHLAALEKLWDNPDPAVRRMLDETRAAVTAAQRRRS